MLPVALTSPLWWVTRWSSRLMTGLAVALALSIGGTAPGALAPPAVTAAASSATTAATPPAALAFSSPAAVTGRAATTAGPVTASPGVADRAYSGPGVPPAAPAPVAAVSAVAAAASASAVSSAPVPVRVPPARSGPRAPPLG